MSRLIFLLSIICYSLFTVHLLPAQYPKDENVSPYPQPVVEQKLVQTFNDFSQWKPLHEVQLDGQAARLNITSTGTDPYVLLPPFVPLDAGTFELRLTFKSTAAPQAELFWGTQKQPGFNPENAVRFDYDQNTKEAKPCTVRFQTDAPLTQLRLDPGMSEGLTEIVNAGLYRIKLGEVPKNPTPWVKPNWADNIKEWKTLSNKKITVKFAADGTGAQIVCNNNVIGEIYPLAMSGSADFTILLKPLEPLTVISPPDTNPIQFQFPTNPKTILTFLLVEDELRFTVSSPEPVFGPVFRPKGTMQEAVLNGAEYLEKGEHSSATSDIITPEHLRFAANPWHITWAFMGLTTEQAGFALLYDNPDETQAIFATPDKILQYHNEQESVIPSHYLGLHGQKLSGTVKIVDNSPKRQQGLNELILWGVKKHGLPELPVRPRDDEAQRQLNLAAFEKSLIAAPNGWRHAATPGTDKQHFPVSYGNDFASAVWQLSGKLPKVPKLDHGGGHLRNPVSFLLMQQGQVFLDWTRNETKAILAQQQPDGSFRYAGKYTKGHWEDTASGHCGNSLYRLMYNYRMLGDVEVLDAVRKGLTFANKYAVPRGAQVWELSLHTPDIMGSSRMAMANVWMYEATGEKQFLDAAEQWAITGLPFVYLRESSGANVMKYATIPVFGATNWNAPNWMGLPVQWCGLDYSEALFMLAEHSQLLDWRTIAEGILITAEQMQYPDGVSAGLLPDSFALKTQKRNPADINPSVLVMQRRRLQGKIDSVAVAVSADKKFRIVSPFPVKIEGNTTVIDGQKETMYQVLINGSELRTINSNGRDELKIGATPDVFTDR
ncbi:MAG: hypothetical protein LBN39_05820 [Planctomycetaceae bacterium]|jgi:hypothetical protein|nr:hypothetical protein [Planctomycetaceae bacterium]